MIIFDINALRGNSLCILINSYGLTESVQLRIPGSVKPFNSELPKDNCPSGPDDNSVALYVTGGRPMCHADVQRDIRSIRTDFPALRLVALCDDCSRADIEAAIDLGLSGMIPGHLTEAVAIAAIQFIIAGGDYFPNSFAKPAETRPAPAFQVIKPDDVRHQTANPFAGTHAGPDAGPDEDGSDLSFTARQREVLGYLCLGHSNKVIARKINISEATVKIHVRHLMKKLGATNRTQAVILAYGARHGAAVSGDNLQG